MTDLTLYSAVPSRGMVVRWMLEEVGEPYEIEIGGTRLWGLNLMPVLPRDPVLIGFGEALEARRNHKYLADKAAS